MREALTKTLVVLACGFSCACDGLHMTIIVAGPSTVVVANSDPRKSARDNAVRESTSEHLCPSVPLASVTKQEPPIAGTEICNEPADPLGKTLDVPVQ